MEDRTPETITEVRVTDQTLMITGTMVMASTMVAPGTTMVALTEVDQTQIIMVMVAMVAMVSMMVTPGTAIMVADQTQETAITKEALTEATVNGTLGDKLSLLKRMTDQTGV